MVRPQGVAPQLVTLGNLYANPKQTLGEPLGNPDWLLLQGIVVAPHLMTGASDSRHYLDITANGVYRFFPLFVNLTAGDVTRVHGIDERIKVGQQLTPSPCMYVKCGMLSMYVNCGMDMTTQCTSYQ